MMAASVPFTPAGGKAKFIENEQEKAEAISEAADILAPFLPLTATDTASILAHLMDELRTEYADSHEGK
jgi:hypothetical protein